MMLQAYGWALDNPMRRRAYNIVVTAVSATTALVVGAIESLGLIGAHLRPRGGSWTAISFANAHLGVIGYVLIGLLAGTWLPFAARDRRMELRVAVRSEPAPERSEPHQGV